MGQERGLTAYRAYTAYSQSGSELKVKAAKAALAINPHCCEAFNVLAEEAPSFDVRSTISLQCTRLLLDDGLRVPWSCISRVWPQQTSTFYPSL